MTEIWKDVPEYEGVYQVSSLGRVKSLARKSSSGRQLNERILKTPLDGHGYCACNLYLNGKKKLFRVHQLVAIAFLNHKPNGMKIVIDHVDNDGSNNRLENLQLISQRENSSKDKKGYSSKYVGVAWYEATSKWQAKIMIDGKRKHLGHFTNEIEAAQAYQLELSKI